ncbi:MAG: hypothetical protein KDD43_11195 [Bdellovibrionales bacterium]|nr:hypothetical protein [Bdellovibrionales bacterium]
MRSGAWKIRTALLASAVGFLCLIAFQNCKFESIGNGGGYTGFQEESAYGPFNPGSTVILPPIGNIIGQPAFGGRQPTTLRDYYLFEVGKQCPNATIAQQRATEVISFSATSATLRGFDCGVESGVISPKIEPIVSSYDPWFVIQDGKIFQLLNQQVDSNLTPYTLALCRQVTGSGPDGVDYGWDVIIQRRGGITEATVIRGRADADSNTNLRTIWGAIPVDEDNTGSPILYRGIGFALDVFPPNPINNTVTSGSMQANLDSELVDLKLTCWLQNQ